MTGILPIERWKYMVTVGLWPKRGNFDPVSWMSNFTDAEKPLALRLLEGFTFYSDELVRQMFRSNFINLSQRILGAKSQYAEAKREWSAFLNTVVIVRVTGEIPSDADSGFAFARLSRDLLGIDEARIFSPEQALEHFVRGGDGAVVFVDDFVGSGNQFSETWNRPYYTSRGAVSFAALQAWSRNTNFYYCPVICTDLGRQKILQNCTGIEIFPGHIYGSRQSALSNDSDIWRDDMRTEGPEFIRSASIRAGLADLNGGVGCWQGFHKLGLALAFSHGYPDATLPIFYEKNDNWRPLLIKGAL